MEEFEWSRFLSVAEAIQEALANEATNSPLYYAWVRTGCSRAYYSAYHTAREKIVSLEGSRYLGSAAKGMHERVLDYFRPNARLHQSLLTCRFTRLDSDYRPGTHVNLGTLRLSIRSARQAITLLHAL